MCSHEVFSKSFKFFKKFKSFFEYLFINCLHIGSRRQGRKSFRNFKKFLKSFLESGVKWVFMRVYEMWKIRLSCETAVSSCRKSLFYQKSACSQSLSPLGHSDSFDSVQPWSFVASASCTDFVRPLVSIHAKAECGATPKARTLWLLAKRFARCKTSSARNAKHPVLKVM